MRRQMINRNGVPFLVRTLRIKDAAAVLELTDRLLRETSFMLRLPGEHCHSVPEEARYIRWMNQSHNSLMLVAQMTDGELAGLLTVHGGGLKRVEHVGYLGMGVLQAHWREGVGSGLLEAALSWARRHPVVQKLSLQVYVTNARAVGLYLHQGFVFEGRLIREVCYDDEWVDMYQMAWFPDEPARGESTAVRRYRVAGNASSVTRRSNRRPPRSTTNVT